jgi:hypothetical protein
MSYSHADYLKEMEAQYNKMFPPIKCKKMYEKAKKTHICDQCGCEIPIGDQVWWYKPNPTYNRNTKKNDYYKWRTRCIKHEPKSHEELKQILNKEKYYG